MMHQYSFFLSLSFFFIFYLFWGGSGVKIKDIISMDYKQLTMLADDLLPWIPFKLRIFSKIPVLFV